jgi:hypothetical protein
MRHVRFLGVLSSCTSKLWPGKAERTVHSIHTRDCSEQKELGAVTRSLLTWCHSLHVWSTFHMSVLYFMNVGEAWS